MGDRMATCGTCGFTSSAAEGVCPSCGVPLSAPVDTGVEPEPPAAWAPAAPPAPTVPTPPGGGTAPLDVSAVARETAPETPFAATLGSTDPGAAFGPVSPVTTPAESRRAARDRVPRQGAGPAGSPQASSPAGISTGAMATSVPGAGGRRGRRRPSPVVKLIVAFIALVVVASQVWSCLGASSEDAYDAWNPPVEVTGPGDGVVPDVSTTPAAGDAASPELREMLDDLMAANSGLPEFVEEPMPMEAERVLWLVQSMRMWRASGSVRGREARLAIAGEEFGEALAAWLRAPGDQAAYDAYDRTWHAWDALDVTWESAPS